MHLASGLRVSRRHTHRSIVRAVNANFEGADMTNAVLDRTDFSKSNLRSVKFVNAVITGTTFAGAQLQGADFEDALIGAMLVVSTSFDNAATKR